MKNLTELLKSYGIEVPDDKLEEFNKEFHQNYKTINEFDKKIGKLEAERDSLKEQLDTANATLKEFDGVDAEGMKSRIAEYEQKMADQKKEYEQELYNRDFADALGTAMEQYKFSSEYAKKSVIAEIKEAGLKLVDGKIIGLNDMVETIKAKDASAFVDEEQESLESHKATFTKPLKSRKESGRLSMTELMKLKNENPDMDISQYLGKGE